jgi:uncharacterized membrane protein YagU involved in acid resistance
LIRTFLQEENQMNRNGRNPMAGIVGGLLGGVLFGAMMQMMGMMGMVAMLVGSEAVGVGWIVHLAISAVFGGVYALALGPRTSSYGGGVLLGAGYGVIAWVVGALVLMPLGLGMTEMVFTVGQDQVMSLIGHLVFGVVLGVVYNAMSARTSQADHTRVGETGDRRASR